MLLIYNYILQLLNLLSEVLLLLFNLLSVFLASGFHGTGVLRKLRILKAGFISLSIVELLPEILLFLKQSLYLQFLLRISLALGVLVAIALWSDCALDGHRLDLSIYHILWLNFLRGRKEFFKNKI